jgi:hypothetical protein
MGIVKNKKVNSEDTQKKPHFWLFNSIRGVAWHETFSTREMAQGMIDHARNKGLSVEGWEIREG